MLNQYVVFSLVLAISLACGGGGGGGGQTASTSSQARVDLMEA
jgi:hypothetical protein